MRNNKQNLKAYVWIIIITLCATACLDANDDANPQKDAIDGELASYLDRNNIAAISTPYGFYYQPLAQSGSGVKPKPRDFVSIYYKLQLTSGRMLDALTSGAPVRFSHLSTDLLPAAINLGVAYMEKGDTFRFFIPAYLAYHDLRIDTLMPAYSNIVAEISLLDVTDSLGQIAYENDRISKFIESLAGPNGYTHSGSVFFSQAVEGKGKMPSNSSLVKAAYTRKLMDGRVIDSGTETFTVGKHHLRGMNEGIRMMNEGDSGILVIPSHKAYWNKAVMRNGFFSTAMVVPSFFAREILIPPFSTLVYEIELLKVE